MKKHILKVWMILAIGFLAVDVAGQTYTAGFPNVSNKAQETATLNVSATVGGEVNTGTINRPRWEPTHYTAFVVLNSNEDIPTIQNVIDWSWDGGGVVPSGRYGEIGLTSPDTEFSYGVSNLVAGTDYVAYFVTMESDYTVVIETDSPTGVPFKTLAAPAPLIATLNPLDNATIPIGTSSFVLTFSENIALANGSFYVELFEGGVSRETQSVGLSHIANNVLTLSFNYSLGYDKDYNIIVPANAIKAATSSALYSGLGPGEWSFTTEAQPFEITLKSPVDGAIDVPLSQSLVATFNQNIQLAAGAEIYLHAYDSELVVETLTSVSGLSVNLTELTINPPTDFSEGTRYYVVIPAGAIETTTGTPFAGVTLKDDWDFTTQNLAPSVVTYDPDGVTAVAVDKVLNLTFDRPVKLNDVALKTIRIRNNIGDAIFYTYLIDGVDTDELLSVSGNVLSIIPPVNFESSTQYYVEISDGAILSLADKSFPGISGTTTWTFNTVVAAAPPVIATGGYSPAPGSAEISRNPVLELTFNENIVIGNSGYLKIFKTVGDIEIIGIPRTNGQVSILDNKLTVSLSNITLEYGTQYYITIDAGFVKSSTTGVDFAGIYGSTGWSFTTETAPPVWANTYPSVSGQNAVKFDLNAMADVTGIVYGVVTGTATQPSVEQIVAGQNSSSLSAKIARNASVTSIVTPTPVEFLFNPETPLGVNYHLHTVFEKDGKYSTVETITIDRIVPEINQAMSLPVLGATTVSINEGVTIVFKEPVFGFDGSGTLPLDNTYFSFQYDDNGTPIDVAYTFSQTTTSEQSTVVLQPDAVLLEDKVYTITIAAVSDASGNLTNQIVRTFETDKQQTWLGVNSLWIDDSNWTGGYVSGKSVTIPGGLTYYPEITNGNVEVHNLTIEPGALLTHTGGALNVTGVFKLKSSADVNASYINNGAEGTTLNVVGSNVSVEQIISNIDLTYLIAAPTAGSSATNFGNYFPLYTYNNTTDAWDAISSGALMAPGVGYRMWTDDSMVAFSGEVNTGSFQVPLTRTDGMGYGWNLVGNPYPASIDWTLLGITDLSTIENAFWMWMPTQRAYGAYSASTDIPINITSSKIPSNHAFLVKVKIGQSTGSLEFIPGAQVANDANYLKSSSTKPVVDYIKLAGVTSNNIKDEMAVAFIDEASTGFDRFDLEKRFANRDHLFELFSLSESMKTAINAIPLNGTYEVPLGFNALKTGNFSIEMVTNKADNVETILVDKLESIETPLLLGEPYDFSVTAKGLNTSRFSLKFLRVSTGLPAETINSNRCKVYVTDREVFVNVLSESVGSDFRVHDFSGRLIQTGVLDNEGVNSLGRFIEGSYIINIIRQSSSTLENHKVVVY